MLKCGFSEVDITPPLGNPIPGYFENRISSGVKDALYAKACVVDADQNVIAFLVLDCIDLRRIDVERIRERVHAATGIEPEQTMVSATHTHTGPPAKPGFAGSVNETYMAWLAEKAADAVVMAYQRREEAHVAVGVGAEGDIAFNRRYLMKDGTYRTNPGIRNPDIVRAIGPIDPDVMVIRIDDSFGNPIGVISSYACHADCVGGTEYSADYPGELSRCIKRELGQQTVSLFMLGACGNINHIDVTGKANSTPDRYLRMGRILAGEVLKVREKAGWTQAAQGPVATGQVRFHAPFRKPSPEELECAEAAARSETAGTIELAFAAQMRKLLDSEETGTEVEIQAIAIGDAAVVAMPAEIFVEFGLDIKERSPFPFTIVNELANGSASGYVCTREAYEQGGYEPRITNNSKLMIGAGERFVEKALELLFQLREQQRTSDQTKSQ
ncbi:neutral/alkaline non-lysosomal ceramidase N-terminal domain-containing protein [Paenibacillus sp. CC-CFT747]|nr:neutral/alkaline non-lysosomal ceramidase N-terminal domain-containing protein [Paenibacillus sp. CC-CFT747]